MASQAREDFLRDLRAFAAACDEPAVRGADDVGLFLRRGMTVASFNLLESFLDYRVRELALHVNGGAVQFLDLPEGLQRRAIVQSLKVASARVGRGSWDIRDLRAFSADIGQSLSAVGSAAAISPFTWLWVGSNVGADDISALFKYFQVDKGWEAMRAVGSRMGFASTDANGDPLNLQAEFIALASSRHQAAHVASYQVTTIALRAIPEQVLRYALALDVILSIGAHRLRIGEAAMLRGEKWEVSSGIELRTVKARSRDYAEYNEKSTRALHVNLDGDALFMEACARATPYGAVLRQDVAGNTTAWAVPAVD